MSESVNIDLLFPAGQANSVVQEVARFAERNDQYSLREEGEGITGRYRIYIERNGFTMEVRNIELHGFEDGTTARFHVQIGRLVDTTSLDDATNLMELIEAVKDVCQIFDDMPVMGVGFEQHQPVTAPLEDDEFPPVKRKFISWLDIYSPKESDQIGRNRLLSAPAYRTEELKDGSVLVLSNHPCTHQPLDEVADHIGIPSWEDLPEFV